MSIKAAVVGVGHLGQAHARIYAQLPDVELVAVADSNAERAAEIAALHKTRALSDYHELLGQVDAVSIVTPTRTHFTIARDFLEAKTHVLVEKPMTKQLEQAQELTRLAREQDLRLQVGHVERFNPAVMAIACYNLVPLFIEAYRISPFRFRSGDIGVVMDLMIHDIDIILNLVDSEVERVDAVGVNLLGSREDIANARLVFASGCVANVTASRVSGKSMREMRIFSPDSYVSLDYGSRKGTIYQKPPGLSMESLNLQEISVALLAGKSFEKIFFQDILHVEEIAMDDHEPLYKELESFINCIAEHKRPIVAGEDGVKAIQTALMITAEINKNLQNTKVRFKGSADYQH